MVLIFWKNEHNMTPFIQNKYMNCVFVLKIKDIFVKVNFTENHQ